jgi:phage tail-like protein
MTVRTGEPVRHALLSGGGGWPDTQLDGLEVLPDGRLELLRVPAVRPQWLAAPADVEPSGAAVDDSCGLYLADAEHCRVVRVDLDCGQRVVLATGAVVRPAGLCIGTHGWLLVADPDRGAVLVFALPALTARDVWTTGLTAPVALAADRERGVFVLDAGPPARLLRLDASGRVDATVSTALAAATAPAAIATAEDGTLYVADAQASALLRFTAGGGSAGPSLPVDPVPSALAVAGDILYAADPASGGVRRLDRHDGRALGSIDGFRGSVAALAAGADGVVYVKTGPDDAYVAAAPEAGREPRGTLIAGPLDAGEQRGWVRLAVDALVPDGARVLTETATGAPPPAAWAPAPALDARLDGDRLLWLRLTLVRGDAGGSPSVREVRLDGDGDSYLAYLPAVYVREDADGFLGRLVDLVQARLGELERAIELAPRRLDPLTAPPEWLSWLARLQAFGVPERYLGADRTAALRDLLAELPALYERLGTPAGVARVAEIHTGVRPTIAEDFAARRIWMLGVSSTLGFDTGLLAEDPSGIVLGDSVTGASGPEDRELWGSALFRPTAHRFTVLFPATCECEEASAEGLRRVLDAEKPAHTEYRLCVVEPRLRVGFQATLGVDAIVGGPGGDLPVGELRLGLDSRLADGRGREQLGVDTVVS